MLINYYHRIFGLDVLRASAILLVLFSHSSLLLFPNTTHILLTIIQFFGAIGVDLFFVLSGYLIGGILIKQIEKGHTSYSHLFYFLLRRWFRTIPNYFLILILNIILVGILNGETIQGIGDYFLFLQNFSSPHPDFFTEAWSLSIEEYAYIFGPLILYILLQFFRNENALKAYMITVMIVIVLISLARIDFHLSHGVMSNKDWSHALRKVVIYRIDSIYYGFIMALCYKKYQDFIKRHRFLFLSIGVIVFVSMHALIFMLDMLPSNTPLFYNLFYLPLVSVSLLFLFPVFINWQTGKRFRNTITKISVWSYGLYLVNYSLVLLPLQTFIDVALQPWYGKIGVVLSFWALAFLLARLLYKYYEKPLMNLRDLPALKAMLNR
ncbi:acyltransferase [Tamlana fucoidanivorans]|uniref:Acyltransferase n=1 Tax=Allotamlana fucoidanivorans TaxID=2583814 RepID=A0A5C4SNG0_9FLAO|nr:acyltransferase [Tamlana fucoidanivorans]TNJ45711.1 acyltransferase [Tamlana fucoidanivorans]